ncbi:MAG: LLM class flavin-dependent oxidoreductase [Acetobacteraceae bacterium]
MWGTEPAAALADHAALAESIGFDSVWVIDSQLLCREVMVTLAAILSRTHHLLAATGVTQPVTRHHSVLASGMATLAELSGGRAVMGIGTGFSSLRTIGRKAARVAEVESCIDVVRRLLRSEAVTFADDTDGRLSWLENPLAVPAVIAATGPRMTRTAARIADGVILHQGLSADLVARALGWVRDGLTGRQDGLGQFEVSCWAPYSLGATPGDARDRVRARVAGALANAQAAWFDGAERDAVERLHASYDVSHHASAAPEHAALVPDSLVERYALAGTAEEVRAQFVRLLDQPGVDRVILTPQVIGAGARPMPDVLRALADQVLDRF